MSLSEECLETDLTTLVIGPYHGALPGPIRVQMRLDGEVIVAGQVETGFLHRGIEKAIETNPWSSALVIAGRLDPEAAAFGELALCLAVEEIIGVEVPPRAQMIRVIVTELTRISSHLSYLARLAHSVVADTVVHFMLRDREKALDLFELLTGARFSISYFRFGGVGADMTEGFIERTLEFCDLMKVRIKEYNDLFSFNTVFRERATGIGELTQHNALKVGMTGPSGRASGLALDIRKAHPYCGYEKLDFIVPLGPGERGRGGDVYDRFLLRLREIEQSIDILRQLSSSLPDGPRLNQGSGGDGSIPPGEGYSRVESARGFMGCHAVSDGGASPCRVQFRSASSASIAIIPELIVGQRVEDLPVIMASLDISVAEHDK